MFRILLATVLITATTPVRADGESIFRKLFDEWYEANPPSTTLPDARAQALLAEFQPEVFLAPGQPRFIDFYLDYIGSGKLTVDGTTFNDVDSTLLNQHKLNAAARFVHRTARPAAKPVAYARYDADSFESNGLRYDFEFLTYNYVFANSGLPRGLRWWQRALAGLVNGNRDWHQLDHYIAATLALHDGQLIAVTLQQHNYMTTWRVPQELAPGPSGRMQFDFAIGSNELYPHAAARTRHPAVSFITSANIKFVMSGKNRPLLGGFDVTEGSDAVEYGLIFLPHADAFYGFRGKLGAKRMLPGRSGPPGADYNTLPAIKSPATAMAVNWRGDSVEKARARLDALMDGVLTTPEGVQAAIDAFVDATLVSK